MVSHLSQSLKVQLVDAPFSNAEISSSALSSLKASLQTAGIPCQCHYLNLQTFDTLGRANNSYLLTGQPCIGNFLFARRFFKNQASVINERLHKRLQQTAPKDDLTSKLPELDKHLSQIIDNWVDGFDVTDTTVVGFSVSCPQLMASLFLAKMLKVRFPLLKIIFGGSFAGMPEVGTALLHSFSFIDIVVFGEGEETLIELTHACADESPLREINGIAFRDQNGEVVVAPKRSFIKDLNKLPMPDHSDYMAQLQGSPWQRVLVPVQTVRGCSWNRCAFCENPTSWGWSRYRDPELVVDEILTISQQYRVFVFYIVDQEVTSDVQRLTRICDLLIKADRGLTLWGHVRAKAITRDLAQKMKRAGFVNLQVGVESFSNSLLKKLRKGTTSLDNITALRYGMEAGICMQYNLIAGFPGETKEEVEENLNTLRLLRHFNQWSRLSGFVLQYGTHVHKYADQYGIKIQGPSDNWASWSACFPEELQRVLGYTEFEFELLQQAQTKDVWQEISKEVSRGDDTYLFYFDTGKEVLVVDSRGENIRSSVLNQDEGRLLRFCDLRRKKQEILSEFPDKDPTYIMQILETFVDNKLMYKEKDSFISVVLPGSGDMLQNLVHFKSLI